MSARVFEGLTLTEARDAYRTLLKLRRIADPGYKPGTHYGRWVAGGGCGVAPARVRHGRHVADATSRMAQVTLARVRAHVRTMWPGLRVYRRPERSKLAAVHIVIHDNWRAMFDGYIRHDDNPCATLYEMLAHHLRPTYTYIATAYAGSNPEYS